MSKIIVFIIMQLFCSVVIVLGQTWNKVNGIFGGSFKTIYYNDITKSVFAATKGGELYRSDNFGSTWIRLESNKLGIVGYLANSSNGTIYSCCTNGLFKSTDNGKTWEITNASLAGDNAFKQVLVTEDNILYCSNWLRGIGKSTDEGKTWVYFTDGFDRYTTVGPMLKGRNNSFFVGTQTAVFRSDDSCKTWKNIGEGREVNSLTMDNDGSILIGLEKEIYKSNDNGNTWNKIYELENVSMFTYSQMPKIYVAKNNIIYACSSLGDVIYSTDKGTTWETIGKLGIEKMVIINDTDIYTAGDGGIYFSNDNGANWQKKVEGISEAQIKLLTSYNKYLFAVDPNQGLFRSSDGGVTWKQLYDEQYKYVINFQNVSDFHFEDNGTTYISVGEFITKTTDYGDTWNALKLSPGADITSVIYDGFTTVFASLGSKKLFYSQDDGESWHDYFYTFGLDSKIDKMKLRIEFKNEGVDYMIYALSGNKLYKHSMFQTENWDRIDPGLFVYSFDIDKTNRVVLSTSSGIFISTDRGINWTKIRSNTSRLLATNSGGRIVSYDSGKIIYSQNNGLSWREMNTPNASLQEYNITAITCTDEDNVFMITTNNGMYKSSPLIVGIDKNEEITTQYKLSQNYPNPFNPSTTISFSLPKATSISLKLYNSLGQELQSISSGYFNAGKHTIQFSANNLSSGIYFYKLTAENFTETKKLMIIK